MVSELRRPCLRRRDRGRPTRRLISSMFWQNSAIQAVPSACSRWPPVGSGALRSKTPMLSSPRKPPSNRFLPKRSLRFTHQLKFSISFRKGPLEELQIAFAVESLLSPVQEYRGPGMDGRVHIAEVPLVGRNLTGRMQERYPAASGRAVLSRNPHRPWRARWQWKAKSHAAYHGYSHLSGIEMMCSLTMWNHSLFRIVFCVRPHRIDAVFLEPFVHVETEVLLGPQHPGQRLPHDEGLIFADPVRRDALDKTHPPRIGGPEGFQQTASRTDRLLWRAPGR